jgi:hypothetical protein
MRNQKDLLVINLDFLYRYVSPSFLDFEEHFLWCDSQNNIVKVKLSMNPPDFRATRILGIS